MNVHASQLSFLAVLGGLSLIACGEFDEAGFAPNSNTPNTPGGNTNVNLGGAQDFGFFRRLIDSNIVPQIDAVDAAGFFAEHHTPLPEPTCGERICVQGMLGVMGNLLTGANCTLLQIGLNSPIVVDPNDRPPLNLAVVVDVSGSMAADGKMDFVRSGLTQMVNELSDDDRIALITYSSGTRILFSMKEVRGRRNELMDLIQDLTPEGSTNLWAGLQVGYEEVMGSFASGEQNRVILLSDGVPTAGVQNIETIMTNSRPYNSDGVGLTTVGLGTDFNLALMRGLAEQGDGNFYFVENAAAVDEVFTEELSYFTVPVAFDLHLEMEAGADYRFNASYGSSLFQTKSDGGTLDIPSVFLAHRTADDDMTPDGGRRGGGSALLVELMPRDDDGTEPATAEVAKLQINYRDPSTDTMVSDEVVVSFPGAPWETPATGHFDNEIVTKSFVMLNILVTFETVLEQFHAGDSDGAIGTLDRVMAAVVDYNEEVQDADIAADLALMEQLREVMVDNSRPPETDPDIPADPWPAD